MAAPARGGRPLTFMPPADDAGLITWLEAKAELGKPVIAEQAMKLNLAYVLGYQWVTWDSRIRAYRRMSLDVADPNAPVRVKANKIGGLLERSVAKLTKTAPEPQCRPVSDDANDVDAARVGTRILSHELDRLDWRAVLQKFLFWPGTLGWSYMHVYWDADAGDTAGVDDPDSGEPLMQGEVCIEEVPAFELRVDPGASLRMEQAKWCVREVTMTREQAWLEYDVDLNGTAERNLAQEVHSLGGNQTTTPQDQWVTVKQMWMLPGKMAPNGMVVTWAQDQIIERKNFPFDHKQLPFVQCDFLPGIGTREGRTWVTDLLDQQADYNDSLSREATIRRTLTPKLLYAIGQIDPQRIGSRVEAIGYLPGVSQNPPHLELPNAAWAQQFELGMARNEKDMGERAGIGEASQGQSASSAPAAAILALQEADDTKLALTATELASFIGKLGWQVLMLCRQYWSEERTVRTWSEEDILTAFRYLGADVDERLDVHVSSESALPKSKAARAQLILELAARYPQLIQPQDVIRMLDVPGVDFLTRSIDDDTRKQWREIGQMLDGDDCVVQPFDNHVIHLQVLNSFRKSLDYEQLDQAGKARFDAHAAVHEMLVMKQLGIAVPTPNPTMDPMAMQQAQQAAAGPAAGMQPQPQGAGGQPGYLIDPSTGMPPDPLAVASGQAPDMLANTAVAKRAGIGQAAGQPGRVPGIPADSQAHSMGH